MSVTGQESVSLSQLKTILLSSSNMLAIYPVGSIYMSVNSTDPSTLFGGTWERIQGRFLFAADSAHAAGSTGGEETHTLTVDEMPSHSHKLNIDSSTGSGVKHNTVTHAFSITSQLNLETENVGGDNPHNNMPPYLSVYMWQRIA